MAEKLAYPKMIRGADGRQKLQYVDLETGEPITDLNGYRVVTAGGTDYYDPTPDGTDTDADEQDLNPDPKARTAQREYAGAGGGQRERQDAAGYSYATSKAREAYTGANRGYINKPDWAKYANFLPGMAGTIAKGVNMAINANNVGAVNSARKAMGLDPVGIGGAIKGTLKDNQGNIARVQVGDGQYSVGFESLDKYGRTNMTPEEAMARANALGVDVSEVTGKAAKPTDAKKGLLTRAKDAILGTEPTVPAQTPSPVSTTSKPASTPAAQTNSGSLASAGSPSSGPVDIGKPAGRPESTVQSAYGPNRPNAPTVSAKDSLAGGGYTVQDAVTRSVQNALGPNYSVIGTSGTEGSLAQFGSNRHKSGLALDFSIKDNVTGKIVTDPSMMKAVAADIAANNPEAGIGYDDDGGYMGTGHMHVDLTGQGGVWGDDGKSVNAPTDMKEAIAKAKEEGLNPNFAYEAPTSRPLSPEEQAVMARQMTEGIINNPLGLSPAMYSKAALDNMARQSTVAVRPEAPIGFNSMVAGRPATPIGSLPSAFAMSPTTGVKDDNVLGLGQSQVDAAFNRVDNPGLGVGLQAGVSNTNPAYGSPMASGIPDFTRNTVRPEGPVGSLPSSRPATSMSPTLGTKDDLSPTAHTSVFSGISPNTSAARSMLADSVANDRFAGVDLSTAAPAKMASLGLISRTQEEKEAMARAIAGELGPASLKALAANDPVAQREVANMVTSMENRLATEKYSSVASMLDPSQYNSLMPGNLGVTNQNYGLYGKNIADIVNDFYNGKVKPDDFGITNYYNPDVASPNWGPEMTNPAVAGQHVFGGLPGDYQPSTEFDAMRDAYAKAQISDTRGFTPLGYDSSSSLRSESTEAARASAASRGDIGYSSAGPGRGTSPGGISNSLGQGGSRADSGIGRSDASGPGRGSSMGGPGIGSQAGAGPGRGSSPGGPSLGGSSSSGTGRSSAPSAGGYTGSPTNDGGGSSKTPGGGF